jgi:hypothetical protein
MTKKPKMEGRRNKSTEKIMTEKIITDRLTNTQILETSNTLLTSIQKQLQFLMEQHLQQRPCPNCGANHNLPEAAGVIDIDRFDFGNHGGDRIGPCRQCGRTLIYTLPLTGGWHWRLDTEEWERGRVSHEEMVHGKSG